MQVTLNANDHIRAPYIAGIGRLVRSVTTLARIPHRGRSLGNVHGFGLRLCGAIRAPEFAGPPVLRERLNASTSVDRSGNGADSRRDLLFTLGTTLWSAYESGGHADVSVPRQDCSVGCAVLCDVPVPGWYRRSSGGELLDRLSFTALRGQLRRDRSWSAWPLGSFHRRIRDLDAHDVDRSVGFELATVEPIYTAVSCG